MHVQPLAAPTLLEPAADNGSRSAHWPPQAGDVAATWAGTQLLQSLTAFQPETNVTDGVQKFIDWYRDYYGLRASEK